MRRREFITLVGGAAAAWPLAVNAQQPALPLVGFLHSGSEIAYRDVLPAFHKGLVQNGLVEGRNFSITYRWAENAYDRLPGFATELVSKPVMVIVAAGGPVAALAAKNATTVIPIVFTAVADPVASGLVTSLSHPGGNVTGNAGLTTELDAKRLEFLKDLVPGADIIGVLVNPNRPGVDAQLNDIRAAAQTAKRNIVVVKAGTERQVDEAASAFAQQRVGAVLIGADPFFAGLRTQLIALMARHRLPAIYQFREFVSDGGLSSYGPSQFRTNAYYLTGLYTGRILKGERPADLPVQQPTKFELVINLKTAKALGLDVPPTVLARADEVIE